MTWLDQLDERQRKEVLLAKEYARNYAHGTTGHMQLMLIAKMAELLDKQEENNGEK